jgi:hypothetical protein
MIVNDEKQKLSIIDENEKIVLLNSGLLMEKITKHADWAQKIRIVLVVCMFCIEQVDMQNMKNREKYVRFAAALSAYCEQQSCLRPCNQSQSMAVRVPT